MRKISLFFVFALLCSVNVAAQDYNFEAYGIYYGILNDTAVAVTQGESYYDDNLHKDVYPYSGSVVIPSAVTYEGTTYDVTTIDYNAFNYCSDLTSISIPESVHSIQASFSGCENLTYNEYGNLRYLGNPQNPYLWLISPQSEDITSCTIHEQTKHCKEHALQNCNKLTSVVWNAKNCNSGHYDSNGFWYNQEIFDYPNGYNSVQKHITSFTFGENVEHIPACLCAGMNKLTSITIPESVTSIGYDVFDGCTKLTTVVWNAKNAKRDNDNYGNSVFGWDGYSEDCPITSFTFGNKVEHIPERLCEGMNKLTSITIPESVTSVGSYVFDGCTKLTTVVWNAKNAKRDNDNYRNSVFGWSSDRENCSITSFTFGNKVEHIPAYLCSGMNNLLSITIPASVKSIESGAFHGCEGLVKTNYMGDIVSWCKIEFVSCYEMGFWSNYGVNPTEYSKNLFINNVEIKGNLNIPEGVTSINAYAFVNLENLTSLTLPNTLTRIGSNAFNGCEKITKLSIPNSVTKIGEEAFSECTALTDVTIGTGLDTLEMGVFYNCNNLKTFVCHSTKAKEVFEDEEYYEDYLYYAKYHLLGNLQLDSVVAPAQMFDLSEPYWNYLAKNIRTITINGGEVTADAFDVINRSYKALKTLDLSATENTVIADEAFKGSYALEHLILPANLEYIGYMAAAECVNLQELDVPATVTDIEDRAFENCRSLETLTFGGVAPQRSSAQRAPLAAQAVSALRRIGSWAFYNCHELQHLSIPEGVTEVGAAAFYGCTYLEDLALPSSVQFIGDNCFALCSKLQEITCLAPVPPTIEAKTFFDVNREIPVNVPAESIEAYSNDEYWSEFINVEAVEEGMGIEIPEIIKGIYSANGQIFGAGDMRIFNITGADVTHLNGQLNNGIYLVKLGDKVQKVFVR